MCLQVLRHFCLRGTWRIGEIIFFIMSSQILYFDGSFWGFHNYYLRSSQCFCIKEPTTLISLWTLWRHMRQLYHAKVYHNKLKLWLYRHKTRTSRWKGKNLMNHLCASIKDLICWKYVFSCIYFQIWNQN